MTTYKRNIGFTLVELLVVMVIILILVGIGIKHLTGAKAKAKNVQVSAGVHDIQVALEQFAIDNNGFYPGLNWELDSDGVLSDVAPGVLGGVESAAGDKDYQNWLNDSSAYLADQTPRVRFIDALIEKGYIKDYPQNPFISIGDKTTSQMTNLFWYAPDLTSGTFTFLNELSVDWDRLTNRTNGQTMKIDWENYARGHFSYVPLDPVNNQGWDFDGDWDGLSDLNRSQYYKYCRSYMLIGWGASRIDTTQSKGFSASSYNFSAGGFDVDKNLKIDLFEGNLAAITRPEQADSAGTIPTNFGATVGTAPQQFVDIDDAFAGATIILKP